MTEELNGLEAALRLVPANMEWLVRTHKGMYFANVCTPEFAKSSGLRGYRYTAYANTPAQAVYGALQNIQINLHDNPNFTKNEGEE